MATIRVTVDNVGDLGIYKDPPPMSLPVNAWTHGKNVRFSSGVVAPSGKDSVALGPLQIPAHWLHYNVTYWVYAGEKTASTLGVWVMGADNLHIELTDGAGVVPSFSPDQALFTGGNINGLVVVNYGSDSPSYWLGTNPSVNKLAWLPWDAATDWKTKNWTAKAIRAHKRWLFALGPTEDDTYYPTRIRNSSAAPPGAIPETWDDTDQTFDAAFVDDAAADKYPFVDGASLGDEFVACTAQTTWIAQATGDNDAPFRWRRAFESAGALTTNCIKTYEKQQYILTNEDLVVHDGSRMETVLSERNRRWLFDAIDPTLLENTFIFVSRATQELLVCFSEVGASYCNKALIVKLGQKRRVGIRELQQIRAMDMGDDYSSAETITFDNADFSFGVSNFPFNQEAFVQNTEDRIGVSPLDQSGLIVHSYYPNDPKVADSPQDVFVEREQLKFSPEVEAQLQGSTILRCTAVYPKFLRSPIGEVDVYVGVSNSTGGSTTWYGPKKYDASKSKTTRIPFRAQGAALGVRFASQDGSDWALSGYELDIVPLGLRG